MNDDAAPADQLALSFADGSATELTIVRADDPSAPVVLCLPAMGVRSSYYEVLADVLAESGFHAVLADLRGGGESSVRASRRVSFGYAEILELELPHIVDSICAMFDREKVIVLGHSLGGQMGLLFAATSDRVSHTIAVASGSAWYRPMPGARSISRFLGLQLIFATTALWGHLPKWFPFAGTEARGIVIDWGYEAMTGRYRVARGSTDYEAALAQSTTPALFVTFPRDSYVPEGCAQHLIAKLGSAAVERVEIPPERFGFKETHHFRWVVRPQAVVDSLTQWLAKEYQEGSREA
ncbi:alpha/beta hydrolase family protein [Actinomadura roseirufa]|uniref:alpha/beta hydrolase family protein n=1 Tax=Actinomadura roseirufa TaxID=2094049 RepID=UPI0010419BD4|nr:alpha/beta fold hydrolase [Actinomadura roseirufa]